jgi:hypothetical protein
MKMRQEAKMICKCGRNHEAAGKRVIPQIATAAANLILKLHPRSN